MGTWMKEIPPKMVHDRLGLYKGQWLPEMDRAWVRKEDGVSVYSRLIRTPWGNVEHVTITRGSKGISFDGSGDLTWMEKYQIKNELFGEKRAQTILLLLDTMDLLTGKTVFTDDHFLLQENGCLWHALGMASSWEKAEKEYHAELQMKNSMLKNE